MAARVDQAFEQGFNTKIAMNAKFTEKGVAGSAR
jgi:hypothetical protein